MHGDELVADSADIARHLAAAFPDKAGPLFPSDPAAAATAHAVSRMLDEATFEATCAGIIEAAEAGAFLLRPAGALPAPAVPEDEPPEEEVPPAPAAAAAAAAGRSALAAAESIALAMAPA